MDLSRVIRRGLLIVVSMWFLQAVAAPQQATNVFEINDMFLPGLGCDDTNDNDGDGLTDADDPDCSSGGAEERPDPWDDSDRWWVEIDTTTWHVELIGPTFFYVYDDDGYIVDWIDLVVNNMFGDADGESGLAYAHVGDDADRTTDIGELNVNEVTTGADWLWGYDAGGTSAFDEGFPFRVNLNSLLLNPVDKWVHPDFIASTHYYSYPLRYNGDTVLVNSAGDLLNIDTGELALESERTDGNNLHSDVFCDTSDGDYDGGYHGWHISDTLAFIDDGDERLVWNADSGCYDEESASSTEIMDDCDYVVSTTTTGEANRFYGASGSYCEEFDQYQAGSGSASTGLIVEYEVTDGEFAAVIDHELTFDPLILNWVVERGLDDLDDFGIHGLHRVGNTLYGVFSRSEAGTCGSEDDFDCDDVDNVDDDLPLDISASVDTDGDGWPDSFNDNGSCDGGPCDENDITTSGVSALDAFPNNPLEWLDSDGDGVGDNSDCYPLDPTQSACPVPVTPPHLLVLLALLMTTLVGWAGARLRR